jgi:pimeloyl-ACP methyl ester carboxylesterase
MGTGENNAHVAREIEANGLRFAYLEEGSGPLVIFLHGFPDNARTYGSQLSAFARAGYRAVAPFMRGYAPTSIPADGKYDPLTLARDVEGLIAALSPSGKAFVVGMDWGGTATFAALTANPSCIERAVVMATPHPVTFSAIRNDPAAVHAMFHLYFFQIPGVDGIVGAEGLHFIDYLWRQWSPAFESADRLRSVKETLSAPGCLKAALDYYPAFFAAAAAGNIPVGPISTPTLTIYGASDLSCKYASLEEPLFKGPYRRHVLPGVGHFPHLEREEEVNQLIIDWLRAN